MKILARLLTPLKSAFYAGITGLVLLTGLTLPAWAEEPRGFNLGTFKGLGAYDPQIAPGEKEVAPASKLLADILSNAIGFLTIISGIFFMLYFIIGGLSWVMSGGKPDKVQKAQDTMTSAAIGLIIVAASYTIIFVVGKVLGIDILNLQKSINLLRPGGTASPES